MTITKDSRKFEADRQATPTQAQIEAADALTDAAQFIDTVRQEAIREGWWTEWDQQMRDKISKSISALTAAAEVKPMDIEDCDGDLAEIEQIVESRANIAAAEVGESRLPQMVAQQAARLERQAIDREIAATIARCAQVVKDCDTLGRTAVGFKEVAIAAIRALKP